MWNFFKLHQDIILGALGLCFAAIIAGYFVWGFFALRGALNKSFALPSVSGDSTLFNIKDAQALLGTLPQATTTPPQ